MGSKINSNVKKRRKFKIEKKFPKLWTSYIQSIFLAFRSLLIQNG